MDPREDDDLPYDDSDDDDPVIRGLRNEMIRLQAQLDQLLAAARERAEEVAVLRNRLTELEHLIEGIRTRYRRNTRLWVAVAAMYGASLGMALSWFLRP